MFITVQRSAMFSLWNKVNDASYLIKSNCKIHLFYSFSDTIYIRKGYKYPKIIIDGYEYKIQYRNNDKTRWTCSNYKLSKCNSIIHSCKNLVSVKNHHNHPSKITKADCEKLTTQRVTIVRKFDP